MEQINQELEQFLWLFTNQWQDDWDNLLPVAEFQYNNHIHSATQNIPFLLDTGQIPCMRFEPDQQWSHVESVNEFKERMEDTLKEAKAALAKSKDDMAKYYNWRRTLLGDALLSSLHGIVYRLLISITALSYSLSYWLIGGDLI